MLEHQEENQQGPSLSKKLNYFINVFAKDYFLVLIADFKRGTVEIARISEPVVPMFAQNVSVTNEYRDSLIFYGRQYISEQDREEFLENANSDHIQKKLADQGTYTLSVHHMYQDRNCPTEINFVDISDEKDGSMCIIAAKFIEDIVRQQTALKKQDEMVKTLVQDYNAIYHIDLNEDTFIILQAQNVVNDDLYDYAYRKMPFETAMNKFIDEMVRDEDKEIMRKISSCAYIKDRLAREEGYSYRFQVNPTRGMRYFEMRIIRAKTDEKGSFAIMTSRNVDESAKEELRVQCEIETANKELSAALASAERANESKTNFISNVSHDMRTPLNAILGYDRLALETEDPALRTDYLKKISEAGDTLLSLINDTLDLQKIENGVTTLHPEPIPCEEMAKKVLTAVKPMMDAKNISFTVDDSKAVHATVNADAMRVEEIFINLLSNAAKFTPQGGSVSLIIACEKETETEMYEKLTVKDNGIGISPEFLPKIYEPFSQERTEATASIGGSGLGLSIVKRLIDLMHGRIEVTSKLGEGTEFNVYLTYQKVTDPDAVKTVKKDENISLSGKTILVCEDNKMNREIVTAILEKNGMHVISAINGREAVEKFREAEAGTIAAVLMDIRMPVMDGYEAAKKIRKAVHPDAKKVPIIALSADVYSTDIEKTKECGMTAHLSKPIDPQLLVRTLQEEIVNSR